MNKITLKREFHLRKGRRGATRVRKGKAADKRKIPDPVDRNARLMAFAIVFDEWLAKGKVRDYAELAEMTGYDSSRITKLMNLRLLEPKAQEPFLINIES